MRNHHHPGFPLVAGACAIFLACVSSSLALAQGIPTDHPNAIPSNTAAIPGRLSSDQMKAILAAAEEENRQAFSDLVQQTSALPSALLSTQEAIHQKFPRMPGTDNCRQGTSDLQSRLGRSLNPKQVDDIVEMNKVLMGCAGQYYGFAPPNSRDITVSVYKAVADEKQRLQQIETVRNAILQAEGALDQSQFIRASQLFQALVRVSSLPHFAESYLQQTQNLREDVLTYVQAAEIDRGQSASLSQQLQKLSREVSLWNECGSKRPLTQAYLQRAIKNGVDAARRQLAGLPAFQFNEASYRIPSGISESEKLALLARHIKAIDESFAKVSDVRAIIAQPEVMKTIGEVIGGSEAASLKATADQIAAAERIRGSLADAQNSLQAKIAAENKAREEAEQKRLAAIAAKRNAEERKQAAGDALNFVNRSFVPSHCSGAVGTGQLCSRNMVLSVASGRLAEDEDFDDHSSNGSVKKSHETMAVAIADLDTNSVAYNEVTDIIEVRCKGKANCVEAIGTSADGKTEQYPNHDKLTVGYFSRKDVNEVASYLKRFLEAQQGKSPSPVKREPSEEEALAFLQAHFANILNMGQGITAVHRTLFVDDDELVETEGLLQYGRQAGALVVRVNLKDLNELMVPTDGGIALICKGSSAGIPNCFSASTGQSSPDHVLIGVSNREQFMKMLKRLMVLHSSSQDAAR